MLCVCAYFLKAQETITRDMIYKTTVRILSDPSFACYGALYEVKDSSITISSRHLKHYNSGKVGTLTLPVNDLNVIHTNKPGSGRRGAWKGAAFGFAAGALFGLAASNGTIFSPAGNMLFFGSAGLIVGIPSGFIIGKLAGHKRTKINGSMVEFNRNKDKLNDYAIKE